MPTAKKPATNKQDEPQNEPATDINFGNGEEPAATSQDTNKQDQQQPDEAPAWFKDYVDAQEKRWESLEENITEPTQQPTQPAIDPNAAIGAQQPLDATQSELAKLNPQTWDDLDAYVNRKIQEGTQKGIDTFVQVQQTQQQQAEAQQKRINDDLDKQVDALQREGLLPAVANENDRNDAGRAARRELYGAAAKLGTTNLRDVAMLTLKPLHDTGKAYDPITDSIIEANPSQPGADSPIGSSSTTTGAASNMLSYKDIHNARSFDELRARAGM